VGEYVRAAAKAFAVADIPFQIRNTFDWGDHLADKHPAFEFKDRITRESAFDVNIFHINADEMANAHRHLGREFFAGKYNIGCWHWELSRFPDAWRPALDYVDEIWATSRFIQHAIAEKARCPVVWMPHPIDIRPGGLHTRQDFGLPESAFLFLFAFDFTAYVARKNPFAVLKAFQSAFPKGGADKVGVVIKLNGSDLRSPEAAAFLASPELQDPRVRVIDEVLDGPRMTSLLEVTDCVVSLHRSEGFGRVLAEAMMLRKPVIATGYSGNVDFTNPMTACTVDYTLTPVGPNEYPYPEGQMWADPDVGQAAWYMRKLASDPAYGARLGRRARAFVHAQHGVEAVGRRYRARLEEIGFL
jgi:glycosyltransferase involved in cell wall biosynthesis